MRRSGSTRRGRLAVLAGLMLVSFVWLALAGKFAAAPIVEAREPFGCEPQVWKTAFPRALLRGESVLITLGTRADCRRQVDVPLDVVLVFDASGSMGDRLIEMKQAAHDFVSAMALETSPGTRMAVVSFSDSAEELCSLTGKSSQLHGCINSVRAKGGTKIAAGFNKADAILRASKSAEKGVALLSDGGASAECDAAFRARPRNSHIASVCVTGNCNSTCMRRLATEGELYFPAGNLARLGEIFDRYRHKTIQPNRTIITDTLPVGLRLLPETIDPPSRATHYRDAQGRDVLVWNLGSLRTQGITLTFAALPLFTGQQPANLGAEVSLHDEAGLAGRADYPIPYITVFGPETPAPPPTPSLTPPPIPSTRPPTALPPTPVQTEPATRLPYRVWMPCILYHPWREIIRNLDAP